MPRPAENKPNGTLPAQRPVTTGSLAAALSLGRPEDLQEAARGLGANCNPAEAPSPIPDEDVDGLSEDGESSQDIFLQRQRELQAVVAPLSCADFRSQTPQPATTATAPAPEETVPTSTQLVEPSATHSEKPVSSAPNGTEPSLEQKALSEVYNADDWDRPVGQTSFWYDDDDYYSQRYNAEVLGEEVPGHLMVGTSIPLLEQPEEPRRKVRPSAPGVYGQIQYETDSNGDGPQDPDQDEKSTEVRRPSSQEEYHASQEEVSRSDYQDNEYYQELQRQEFEEELEEDLGYNPECTCQDCLDQFVAEQRDITYQRFGIRAEQDQKRKEERQRLAHAKRQMTVPPQAHGQRTPSGDVITTNANGSVTYVNGKPTHARGSRGGNPYAVVACCYFKKKGFCKMGKDCWYSHDADENTPCHYGALCKDSEHRALLKGATPAQQLPRPVMPMAQQPFVAPAVQPKLRPAIPAHQAHVERTAAPSSALLIPSDVPCAFCGAQKAVLTQEFPVYSGHGVRSVGTRAHCTSCLRTYSL